MFHQRYCKIVNNVLNINKVFRQANHARVPGTEQAGLLMTRRLQARSEYIRTDETYQYKMRRAVVIVFNESDVVEIGGVQGTESSAAIIL